VINVSSRLGSMAEMSDGWPGYGISKAALNAATRKLAAALAARGISVNAAFAGVGAHRHGRPGGESPDRAGRQKISSAGHRHPGHGHRQVHRRRRERSPVVISMKLDHPALVELLQRAYSAEKAAASPTLVTPIPCEVRRTRSR